MKKSILELLENIKAIAQEGLFYSKDPYDQERYQKLLALSSEYYEDLSGVPRDKIKELFLKEAGCITPKLGVEVLVHLFKDHEKNFLILKRTDDYTWCFPCGFVDVQEGPFEAAQREVEEETGLKVKPEKIIEISKKGPLDYPLIFHQVNIFMSAEIVKLEKIQLSHEHCSYMWVNEKNVEDLKKLRFHPGHELLLKKALDTLSSKRVGCGFD